MNKEQAKTLLEDWMSVNHIVVLPIVDQVIYSVGTFPSDIEEWTFKGLIKIAYDLEDTKPKTKTKSLDIEARNLINDFDKKVQFLKWIKYRKSLGKTIRVQETLERLAQKFNDTDIHIIEQVVNHSIDNQYQGLFWDKYKTTESKSDTANNWLNNKL